MSWRLLFLSLLIVAGVATWGGLQAGDWLIEHAPVSANVPNVMESDPNPMVDADGRPIQLQPQQPLMSGAQGVPKQPDPVQWQVDAEEGEQAIEQAVTTNNSEITVGDATDTLDGGHTGDNEQGMQPIRRSRDAGRAAQAGDWEPAFRQAMSECRALGFFDRPACLSRVRNQYCGANNAWGNVSDCPSR
ncbi:hypothetical protein CAP48_03835 [Advenella sp. S44]|uniref:hypothetical protein n=1 Tax=Advenella sp. S44 TaxID=1982755 RepID=UPI000C2A6F10|nr:hypothetical protein [Advenella sp. S44]PJX28381.1 hypothetical protein CAP48_03835 [Advenella sp. S44]